MFQELYEEMLIHKSIRCKRPAQWTTIAYCNNLLLCCRYHVAIITDQEHIKMVSHSILPGCDYQLSSCLVLPLLQINVIIIYSVFDFFSRNLNCILILWVGLSHVDCITMQTSIVIWLLLLLSLSLLLLWQKPWRILVITITILSITRCIITLGIQPTLWLLGLIQVSTLLCCHVCHIIIP